MLFNLERFPELLILFVLFAVNKRAIIIITLMKKNIGLMSLPDVDLAIEAFTQVRIAEPQAGVVPGNGWNLAV